MLHLRQCPNQMEHTSPSGDTGVFSSAVEKLGIASNGGDERAMGETASRGRSLGVAGNTHGDTRWPFDWHELSLPGAIDCSRSPGLPRRHARMVEDVNNQNNACSCLPFADTTTRCRVFGSTLCMGDPERESRIA